MTLHEAIVEVLETKKQAMSTQAIADELNKTKTYQKKDGSKITAFQIHGRTRNYSQLFERDGKMVSLLKTAKISVSKPKVITPDNNKNYEKENINKEINEAALMDSKKFRSVANIDLAVPKKPGLYCIRIKDTYALPEPFRTELTKREHNIIYIGIASKSLHKRMLNQELRANGHGTFFRSLGAVLGYKPPFNSLSDKKNKRNYKFSSSDEKEIINWINQNLLVNWISQKTDLEKLETILLKKYQPILNIAKNPAAIPQLSTLRKNCVDIASGIVKD